MQEEGILPTKQQNNSAYTNHARAYNGYGNAGRFFIPDVGISVALFYSTEQWVVDAGDSANIYPYLPQFWTIGDHWNQSFNTLYYVQPGTSAYIEYVDGSRENYVCTGSGYSWRTEETLYDWNNVPWDYWTTDLATFTCAGTGDYHDVFVATWDRIW